ncbi:cardiac-enriched FHL2-interacting protein [Perognathus longimembris pacificus]|uniref:cardiac-enriched FHL2-interacting protein n=1 Tax=Perognathus longimembris pacificus TaxID=214514 RepID=UPI0020189460|nr:cardiac-enriched FHL2-interacting protein [Perognathus longimembris pacificus]
MQGSKKGTDAFSDTSSIGSVLDDADREVSNLTDRAFRSLCISEDTSFQDSDLTLSPESSRQGIGSFHQETVGHTQRKSGIWTQLPSQGTEHTGWAATFQQLPKYAQGEERYPKTSPPPMPAQRRLEVPVSGLRSSTKPISKVSSLIKSFDRPESQHCDNRPPPSKPPALKNPPKFAPLPESGVNFCFDSAFLTVRRVPAEVSNPHQSGHQPGRNLGEQEAPKNSEMASHSSGSFLQAEDRATSAFESRFPSPPNQSIKAEPERSKEWAPRGTFLHSENSAFESWNAHQPKLLERKEVAETIPESKAPRHYEDKLLLREPHAPDRKVSPCQARSSCTQEENQVAPGPLCTSGSWGPRDPGALVFPAEEKSSGSQSEPQAKPSQPPWRKPKPSKGGKDNRQDTPEEKKQSHRRELPPFSKHNPPGQFPDNDAPDISGDPSEHYSPPFNISKLLTPIIPAKHPLESSDPQQAHISPSPPTQLNGYQEKESSEHLPRDSYKSKAPSLLFNLKDVRKRVKSTYSPSPLLKGFDEKHRGKMDSKQEAITNGVMLPNGLEESPPEELSKESPTNAPSPSHSGTQGDPSDSSSEIHPTLNSPATGTQAPFCVNGEAIERRCEEKKEAEGEAELGLAKASWHPDSKEHYPRKHLSLKLCDREPETGQTAEKTKIHQVENGLSRSISQETEPEQKVGLLVPPLSQKLSPAPLSPEEEEVFYSDSQSDFMPSLQSKAKVSTSSSDQSFASFEDQQKSWFPESQWEDRKKDMSACDSQKDKKNVLEKVDPPDYSSHNGDRCVEKPSQGRVLGREGAELPARRPRKASTEEGNLRGSWIQGKQDTSLSHANDALPSPASAPKKHKLFTIKDNTLRATPVIKPIILPLLRTTSSEDALISGHREEELQRQAWGEDAGGLCAPPNQEMPSIPTSASLQGTYLKHKVGKCLDPQQVYNGAKMESSEQAQKGDFPPELLAGGGAYGMSSPDVTHELLASDGKSKATGGGALPTPRHIPTITFPQEDSEAQPPGTYWEEQEEGSQTHFLSPPRAGLAGRRLVPCEMVASPYPSSLGESSACSPAASSLWDDGSQIPSDLGLLPEEPPASSSWASPSPARLTRREDLTHGLMWEADSSDLQLEGAVEDGRTLSPKGALLEMAGSSAGPSEKSEHPAYRGRTASKPPAVPPKTEKALRRAKKLASKRKKTDRVQEKPGEAWENLQGTEHRPTSPRDPPGARFPVVRALPPPTHRHSVSGGPEPMGRRPWGPQALTPLPPYPATQKILQDPQSGEYFVFDLPLQVKIKTFYDPETGKYVKISVPSSEGASPEPPLQDALAAPYLLYPGFRPVPVTTLMPVRCSSQLSAPTFLRQGPRARPQSIHGGGLQPAPGPQDDPTPQGPPQSLEEGTEASGLNIISTEDLEDFATEGIS